MEKKNLITVKVTLLETEPKPYKALVLSYLEPMPQVPQVINVKVEKAKQEEQRLVVRFDEVQQEKKVVALRLPPSTSEALDVNPNSRK